MRWAASALSGVVTGTVGLPSGISPSWTVVGVAVATLVVMLAARRERARRLTLFLLVFAASVCVAVHVRSEAERRTEGWIPSGGRPIELHVNGRVRSAPEPAGDGERRIIVIGSPSAGDFGDGEVPAAGIRLNVRSAPGAPTQALERLRRGDRIRVWCRVRRAAPGGNPGATDPRRVSLSHRIDAFGTVKSGRLVELREKGPVSPLRLLDEIKVRARHSLDRAFPDVHRRAILGATLLGDRAALPPDSVRLLRDAGLVHLLAISGLHVGLVILGLFRLLKSVPVRRPAATAVAACVIATFAAMVGPRPPILRAAGSAGILLFGRAIHRDADPMNSLAVVAGALALWNPFLVIDPAYQLSFVATAGILCFAGPVARAVPLPRVLSLPLGVSVSAYIATAPAVAWHFGRLAPVAVLSNLVAAPLCAIILGGGFATLALPDLPSLGGSASWIADMGVRGLLAVAQAASELPASSFRVARPPIWFPVVYYLLLAGLAGPLGHGATWRSDLVTFRPIACRRLALCGVAVLLALVHLGPFPRGTGRALEVVLPDVGQGQALVLRGPKGGCVLVDAGPAGGRYDAGERIVSPVLSRLACRRLDALVLSHDHDDHAGGAETILREFEVGEVWIFRGSLARSRTRDLARTAMAAGAAVIPVEAGFRARRTGISFEVLHPNRTGPPLDANNESMVIRAAVGERTVLVPGDLEASGERSLLGSGADPVAEVLVVGHHGAANGTIPELLEAVRPALAVVSAGRWNRFGHPAPSVLARLRRAGARVFRTDVQGMIRLEGDGGGWTVEPFRRGSAASSEP